MNKQIIFGAICKIAIAIELVEFGKILTIRRLCYDAEKHGKGKIVYKDIYRKNHVAVIEAI